MLEEAEIRTTKPASKVALALYRDMLLSSIRDGRMDELVMESVRKRISRSTTDDMELFALGRVLEEMAREAGTEDLGDFLDDKAQFCLQGEG
jgi:hypothetical protein